MLQNFFSDAVKQILQAIMSHRWIQKYHLYKLELGLIQTHPSEDHHSFLNLTLVDLEALHVTKSNFIPSQDSRGVT